MPAFDAATAFGTAEARFVAAAQSGLHPDRV